MAKASELAKAGCPYLGDLYSDMDCQKFVENCLDDIGIRKDLPGSNAWYREMTWVGSPEDCKKKFGSIPAGAFLFIWANDGGERDRGYYDGKGNASHIGIYTAMTGNQMVDIAVAAGDQKAVNYNFGDGAIHSSSSRAHVCTSKFQGKSISGGWNRVGLWNRIDYGSKINGLLGGGSLPDPDETGGGTPMDEYQTAKVYAPSGSTVNLRKGPSKTYELVDQVPIGETVEIIGYGDNWCMVEWHGKTGYMMTQFLEFPDEDTDSKPDEGTDPNMILVQRSILEDMYDQLAQILGLRG